MCKAMEDMRTEAMKEGKNEGINLILTLVQKLRAMGRNDDVEKVLTDGAYCKKLLAEFNMG